MHTKLAFEVIHVAGFAPRLSLSLLRLHFALFKNSLSWRIKAEKNEIVATKKKMDSYTAYRRSPSLFQRLQRSC